MSQRVANRGRRAATGQHRWWGCLLAVALLLTGRHAAAEPPSHGVYAALTARPVWAQDSHTQSRTSIEYDRGYAVGGAMGYRFAPFRLEGELSFARNGVRTLANPAVAAGSKRDATGNETVLSLMANAYIDWRTGAALTPYVGAGAGRARVTANNITAPGFGVTTDDSDSTSVYQAMAGVAYALTDHVEATLEYRYLRSTDMTLKNGNGSITDLQGPRLHGIGIGLRLGF